jgi:3-oxoacyl-[acyl-carrier-protein] synthase-3
VVDKDRRLGGSVTALEAVAVHLPPQSLPIEQVVADLGLEPRQATLLRRFHGLDRVRFDPDGTLYDLLLGAARALEPLRGREARVRYVLHARSVTQVPYPLNPLHQVCRELGLEHAPAFTVTHHACASGLLAVDVAGRLLAADGDPDALALVLAGEKAFTRDARLVPQTSLFGEGAAAALVRGGGGRDRVLSYSAVLRGEFDGRLAEDPDLLQRYQRAYPELLAEAIHTALDAAKTDLGQISLILPHNVNRISWRTFCKRVGFPVERVLLDNVPELGHGFAADAFINHRTATDRGLLRPGDRYLVAAAGVGGAFSAIVLEN